VQPVLQWTGNKYYVFWVCALSCRYPACNVHAPYCHLWPACLAVHSFSSLSHKRQDFLKKLLNLKCVLWFSLQLLSETFVVKRRSEWHMDIGLHVRYLLFLSDFNETWIFMTDFQKYSSIKFHENLSSGSWVVPCRETDMTKLIVTFCNFANPPK